MTNWKLTLTPVGRDALIEAIEVLIEERQNRLMDADVLRQEDGEWLKESAENVDKFNALAGILLGLGKDHLAQTCSDIADRYEAEVESKKGENADCQMCRDNAWEVQFDGMNLCYPCRDKAVEERRGN